MKNRSYLFIVLCLCSQVDSLSQEQDKSATVSLFAGAINYQGDLNPNSFTLNHAHFSTGIIIRKPLNSWFALRGGVNIGTIKAADAWNRDYLKPRNLSFGTSIQEAYLALEVSLLDFASSRLSPFMYGGIAVFHFNPWANDNEGKKTFLKPLSTEGQGLPEYPEQKPYSLIQWALPFGGGLKYAVTDGFSLGIDFSQRKTFTDYLDDVSSHYVDAGVLERAKGKKAIEMAYRSDELPGGRPDFPNHGEQRGTPSEMDWYYYLGLTIEMKLNRVGDLFNIFKNAAPNQRCPAF